MMLSTSRSCSILCSKPRLDTQIITNAVYVVIFIYLLLYSIFNTVFLDVVSASRAQQLHDYDIEMLLSDLSPVRSLSAVSINRRHDIFVIFSWSSPSLSVNMNGSLQVLQPPF